ISILPSMIGSIPAQANNASGELKANVPGALVSSAVYLGVVSMTLVCGWGLLGIAAAVVAMRTVEAAVRLIPLLPRARRPHGVALPPLLRRRMAVFSTQSLALVILNTLVWERSEVLFLKYFVADTRQLSFYSVTFSLVQAVLVV